MTAPHPAAVFPPPAASTHVGHLVMCITDGVWFYYEPTAYRCPNGHATLWCNDDQLMFSVNQK